MSHWNILGISPTNEIKDIKRAYAKKLKAARPDENPHAFQALYQAYQFALDYAARCNSINNQSHAIQSGAIEATDDRDAVNFVESSTEEKSEEQIAIEQEHQLRLAEFQRILSEVEKLLAEQKVGGAMEPWKFIVQSPYILEDQFNWLLGKEIFRVFSDYLHQRVRSRGRYYARHIRHELLFYCDEIFSWRNNSRYLESEFGEEICKTILIVLDENRPRVDGFGVRGGTLITDPNKSLASKNPDDINFVATVVKIIFFIVVVGHIINQIIKY